MRTAQPELYLDSAVPFECNLSCKNVLFMFLRDKSIGIDRMALRHKHVFLVNNTPIASILRRSKTPTGTIRLLCLASDLAAFLFYLQSLVNQIRSPRA